ncbi:Na+/H+ antiporter subunit E [Oharaeibacter diazotrophicus]|uniref:Multicomponent Na+:H+ antiporter subunit E n=1 Tax=Oharaeibacter diazotrophicus TaxID=1920512 RepID=A0A4V3CVP3_9HYPH|nr:Na+/H+ antiporter subunit E [Oharaeibacter diazotrophicus]TDP83248.1 multicomponent Na+:H+ antiporter subunit E [Oharaeibacter diazotrophicus]BBE72081.1 Na(+)/H(+) antiporter subunit E [Pleomorphomonas sp. SM30]GLS78846.1 Na+/H+ antiporter subunit E [Oharaeibacter diazotrophicus]
MTRFALALAFTVAWAMVSGSFAVPNLLFGALLAAAALYLIRDARGSDRLRIRPLPLLALTGVFLVELLKSGLKVAATVLRRDMGLQPGIVAYPLAVTRDFEITLLANLITLTPGTLSVDVSDDRRLLYVHCIDAADPAAVVADIRNAFERRIMEAFR